ncbi:response regulator [Chloroflexota bacterium]
MNKIKVFIADDHKVLREGIRLLLEKIPDIEVVGEASSGEEAVAEIERLMPEVVLMDITMPGLNGLDATRQIKSRNTDVKVLILTVHETDQYLAEMLDVGASGYVVKSASGSELISAIRAVAKGDVYLYPSIARHFVNNFLKTAAKSRLNATYEGLTSREIAVLRYIAEDKKNKEIADILGISIRTVQAHRTNLMDKLGAHDRTELVKYAIRKRLIEP